MSGSVYKIFRLSELHYNLYNMLDLPVAVVTVTEVTAEDEDQLKHYRGNFGDVWDTTFVTVNMTHFSYLEKTFIFTSYIQVGETKRLELFRILGFLKIMNKKYSIL